MSETNDTKELPEGMFTINLKPIDQYLWKYPMLMAKYKNHTYKTSSFCGGINIDINLITCKDDAVLR